MTDIHIVGLKIGLKNINLLLYDQYFYVFVFLGMLHYLLLYYGAGNNWESLGRSGRELSQILTGELFNRHMGVLISRVTIRPKSTVWELLESITSFTMKTYEFKRCLATGCFRHCVFLVTHNAVKYCNGHQIYICRPIRLYQIVVTVLAVILAQVVLVVRHHPACKKSAMSYILRTQHSDTK